jgi:hypothetical protein
MNNPKPWWLAWPVSEVAATILPLFSQAEYHWEREVRASIVNWCMTGVYKSTIAGLNTDALKNPDHRAVTEAIQVLEHARLVVRICDSDRSYVGLTRLGYTALQTNTVRTHLGLSDAPPMAESNTAPDA